MMSTKGRQEIPDKQIAPFPPTLEQRIRRDINRAQRTRESMAYVMSLKTVGDKPVETKDAPSMVALIMAVRKFLTMRKRSASMN